MLRPSILATSEPIDSCGRAPLKPASQGGSFSTRTSFSSLPSRYSVRPLSVIGSVLGRHKLHGRLLGRRDLDLAVVQADFGGRFEFRQRAGTEDHVGLFHQPQGDGIGAANIGPQPIARLEQQRPADRRPAPIEHRLDGHDALHIGDFADAAVFGERFLDGKLLVGNRFVESQKFESITRCIIRFPQLRFQELEQAGLDVNFRAELANRFIRHSAVVIDGNLRPIALIVLGRGLAGTSSTRGARDRH